MSRRRVAVIRRLIGNGRCNHDHDGENQPTAHCHTSSRVGAPPALCRVVALPAAIWGEKDGTYTNSERRVRSAALIGAICVVGLGLVFVVNDTQLFTRTHFTVLEPPPITSFTPIGGTDGTFGSRASRIAWPAAPARR